MSGNVRSIAVAGLLTVLAVALAAPPAGARSRFDVRVFAREPDPASVALTVLGPDRTLYGGTFFPASGNAGDGTPSRVFAWGPDGRLLHTWTIAGEDLSANHGTQAAVVDVSGDVYLLEAAPAQVIRLDPRTGAQSIYATIPHLPICGRGVTSGCKDALVDNPPEPDYAAWGPDGSLYVTDQGQPVIFRVPPGGGTARVWLTDPRFDAVAFALTGLALGPDHRTLYANTVGSSPLVSLDPADGSLMQIPIKPDGSPGPIRTLWKSRPLEGPDGFALARSGHIYLALIGPMVNQIVELSASGQEITRFPSASENAALPVPFDSPSSVTFDGTRLLITNDSYFANNASHEVIFDVEAGEVGMPVFIPAEAGLPRLWLRVTPRVLTAGVSRVLRIVVRLKSGTRRLPPPRGTILRIGRHKYAIGARGTLSVRVRFAAAGRVRVRVSTSGALGASVALVVRRAPS